MGVVTLNEIGPIWTIDRQDKSLKSHAVKSAAVGKFQSNRLNVTTPFAPPALLRQMVNGGLAIDDIFGQSNHRIGIGITWAEPADRTLRDQKTVDIFYRIQMTPEIAVSPTLQFVFDPSRNPAEDMVTVGDVRTRFAF